MASVITALAGVISAPLLVLVAFLFYPEKVEKLWAMALAVLVHFRDTLHRRQVTHDLQGRVNEFVRGLRKAVPGFEPAKLKLAWVDEAEDRKAFFDRGEIVLRVRRGDPDDLNFVHGAYLYVAETLLYRAKRYTSPSQREALDLYTTAKLLEAERPRTRGHFVDLYLHPRTANAKSKVGRYLDNFSVLDHANLYFPVLLRELEYLGQKVFGQRKAAVIIEVDQLIRFLEPIATRKLGDENDLTYRGSYCKFGLVIVGKPAKLFRSIDPYVRYIRRELAADGAETIYLVARAENVKRLEEIYDVFADSYLWASQSRFSGVVRYKAGEKRVAQVLVVLRKRGLPLIQAAT